MRWRLCSGDRGDHGRSERECTPAASLSHCCSRGFRGIPRSGLMLERSLLKMFPAATRWCCMLVTMRGSAVED